MESAQWGEVASQEALFDLILLWLFPLLKVEVSSFAPILRESLRSLEARRSFFYKGASIMLAAEECEEGQDVT